MDDDVTTPVDGAVAVAVAEAEPSTDTPHEVLEAQQSHDIGEIHGVVREHGERIARIESDVSYLRECVVRAEATADDAEEAAEEAEELAEVAAEIAVDAAVVAVEAEEVAEIAVTDDETVAEIEVTEEPAPEAEEAEPVAETPTRRRRAKPYGRRR